MVLLWLDTSSIVLSSHLSLATDQWHFSWAWAAWVGPEPYFQSISESISGANQGIPKLGTYWFCTGASQNSVRNIAGDERRASSRSPILPDSVDVWKKTPPYVLGNIAAASCIAQARHYFLMKKPIFRWGMVSRQTKGCAGISHGNSTHRYWLVVADRLSNCSATHCTSPLNKLPSPDLPPLEHCTIRYRYCLTKSTGPP